jgi:pilus assembly protein CpaB
MNRRLVSLLVAALLAAVGTATILSYVRAADERAESDQRLVAVLVVADPIAKGTRADQISDRVKTERVPAKVRADNAVRNLGELSGRVAAVDLVPGEQLVSSRWVAPEAVGRAGVPEGLLEVTLSLDPERALGGQLRAGDTVAVLASFKVEEGSGPAPIPGAEGARNLTHLILHKVRVTAVQIERSVSGLNRRDEDEDEEGPAPAPTGKLLITLALDAPSVERVVFAAEHGTVWLSAEPLTAPEDGTKIVTPLNEYQ